MPFFNPFSKTITINRTGCAVLITLFLMSALVTPTQAQDELIPDEDLSGWSFGWTAGLNGSQAAYSNWSRGGVNTFSAVGTSQVSAFFREGSFSYGSRLLTNYGETRLEDEGVRKSDDRLSFRNRFLYDLSDDFGVFLNLNFESQFANGFDYGAGPDDEDILISSFLAPGYITENSGLAWYPQDNFSLEAGFGMKQTIVLDTDLGPIYGLDEGERLHNQAGLTTAINFSQEIFDNVEYSGFIETFTNLNRSIRSTDVTISNRFIGRINNFLNMTLQFDLVYDDDYSTEVQLSQVLSAGISVVVF